ncbi:TlyA family RNA methyltransferase [Bifidobacterium simiarum]|uniref:TlyA family rRNA (Cytidine-2'-O)-methyltransferase n=1 Tax=Bifidobacterium simiarum TaxID=2045441 RepID=A0A2M9HEB4_9BIFI|nr:TlyA family RNA methyltransferase [Bifidobacterium simiarum]PJM75164.1 TlyA family rRNA (cytidine-2'-O)-methyltransferase [Bifidobacterium simiarum]
MSQRLDAELVERALVQSRSRAQRLVREGRVTVNGRVVTKPAAAVTPYDEITVDRGEDYVSRGAYKLVGAFDVFSPLGLVSPQGLRCLDIGASTGGFTEVLLRRGATHVVALDVGHGQLAARIADDVRVTDMSGVNIRDVKADDLPWRPDMIVSDVSFISLTYVIPVIARIVAPNTQIVLLVKPQFEVGREHLGKNGIVEHEEYRRAALEKVTACAEEHGLTVRGTADSPISGTHGNHEYLLWLSA